MFLLVRVFVCLCVYGFMCLRACVRVRLCVCVFVCLRVSVLVCFCFCVFGFCVSMVVGWCDCACVFVGCPCLRACVVLFSYVLACWRVFVSTGLCF